MSKMRVNSIRAGTMWSLLGQLVNIVFGFAILILTTRYLGPDQYGQLQTILTLIILSVIVADFGFSSSVARYVAENQESAKRKSQYIFNGLFLKISTSFLIVLLLIYVLPAIGDFLGVELERYSFILIVITLLRSLREFLLKVMQGLRRFDLATKLNVFYNIANMLLVAILLIKGFGINAVLISEIIITLLFLGTFIFTNRKIKLLNYTGLDKSILKDIMIYCIPMFFISMSFYIYMKTDTLMIQYFMNSLAVGYYSLSTMIIGKVHSPLVAIGNATGPALVLLEDSKRSSELVKIFKVTFLITLPICLGLLLVSKELILVFFGLSFSPTISVLQLMTIFLFFYCLNSVLTPVLDYLGFARNRAVMVGISATINFLLNMILIPRFGIVGAVYSTLLTYGIYSLIVFFTVILYIIKGKEAKIEIGKTFIKILLISLVMAICVYLAKMLFQGEVISLIVSIIVGVTIYLLLAINFKIITKNEIRKLFGKKLVE